ncbi:MAG: hypothetical protein PHN80_12490 [Hespellia sp.]|nr:hypothetical protein [Hespellia sp.]
MSELLFNRSETVANLNKIEGFNPLDLLRIITDEERGDQAYLDVKYRKLWFRLCHPTGKIVKKIMALKDNMAIVEARVYLDKNDPEDSYIASALAQKFYTDDPKFGNKFLELAETAATGRALADAGFGIQFVEGEESDPVQVDAGFPVPSGMAGTQTGQAFQEQPLMQGQAGVQESGYMQSAAGMMPPVGAQMQQNQMYAQTAYGQNTGIQGMPPSQPVPPASSQPIAQKPPIDHTRPVEELAGQITYEEAKAVVIGGNGVHANKTMGQIAMENPSTLEWYLHSYKGKDNLIRAAAQVLLQKAAA